MSEQFNIVSVCCKCGKVYGFILLANPDSPTKESHGYCSDCGKIALEEANAMRRES